MTSPQQFKATLAQVEEFITRMHKECLSDLLSHTVPFFAEQNDRMIQFGSGVLLKIAHGHFVVTAAHILDHNLIHELPMYISDGAAGRPVIPFHEVIVRVTKMPGSQDRMDDRFDIGVGELQPSIVSQIGQAKKFLYLRDIDHEDQQVRGSWYVVVGFPSEANGSNRVTRIVSSNAAAFGAVLYEGQRGPVEKFDRDVDIVLDFQRNGRTDDLGNSVMPPEPGGMSGCGIWRLAQGGESIHTWKPDDKRLVGIQHTWERPVGALRGVQIKFALQIIHCNYPDLQAAMALNYDPFGLKT